jgi:hypothetical protein
MYASQAMWIDLYDALLNYRGANAYADILEPWRGQHEEECRWLTGFAARGESRAAEATDEELCRLYAASRVTSLLLLRFQQGRADGTDYPGPPICPVGFQLFHEAVGFHVPAPSAFHPFFHEIIGVRQVSPPETPIELIDQAWPPLMLGDMMYCRAGCVVSGGTEHVVKEVAERSKLYWSFRRKDRPHSDQSHGWGSNSQWRTQLRRDYWSPGRGRYNVDGKESLNELTGSADGVAVTMMVELIRHRCLIRTAVDDSDLDPYRYTYTEAVS